MKITDIEAFKGAQLMARIAVSNQSVSNLSVSNLSVSNLSGNIPADAFWAAAMQALKAAYTGAKK